jgi:hypothetical protein
MNHYAEQVKHTTERVGDGMGGDGGWGDKTWADDKATELGDDLEIERDLARCRMRSLEPEVAREIEPQKLFVSPPAKAW